MSETDKMLIEKSLDYADGSDWNEIEKLMKEAESDEAKSQLKKRMIKLYRREEHFAGL